MEGSKLISVIIPIYNVEKYLDKCIQSIVDQTYKNLEIILVDDGSPDNCPKICDEWAGKDKRIKVIHKPNGGVSSARNFGLDAANGKYIGFVDADDIIDVTMYEKLYNSLELNNADISMCSYKHIYEDGAEINLIENNIQKVNGVNIIKYFLTTGTISKNNIIYTDNIMGSVCRTLIKKEVINDTRFSKLSIMEDLLFLINIIDKNIKIAVVNESLYKYLQRDSSAVHNFNSNKIEQRYIAFKNILNSVKNKVDEDVVKGFKFYNYASLVNEMLKNDQKKLLQQYLKDDFFVGLNTKENYNIEKKNAYGLKRKIGYFLVYKKWFFIYSLLVKIK